MRHPILSLFLGLFLLFGTSCQKKESKGSSSFKKKEIVLYHNEGSVAIPTSEPNPPNPQEIRAFLRTLIKPGDLVFDVGAHEGQKTELYLECGARVICFEPQPRCVETLKTKFGRNKNVAIEPIGLSSQEGTQTMFVCSSAPTISTLSREFTARSRFSKHGYKWDEQIVAQLSTLDQMIQKHGFPRYCKIDVENYEIEVLKGLSEPPHLISFECNTDQLENTKKCLDYLVRLGYREFNLAFAERGLLISSEWLSAEALFKKIESIMATHDFSRIWGLWGDIYARKNPSANPK